VNRPDARRELLLALADDELVTGHRASHWTGVAPSLEEDLAFSTIAQDEINHADVWYQVLVGAADDVRAEVDALGLGRSPDGYRHAVLCEQEPGDFAYSLARHWLYDHADTIRLRSLAGSSDPDIAAVSSKLLHEERYHLEHADLWFARLTTRSAEAHGRLAAALEVALPQAVWLFEPIVGEDVLLETGIMPESSATLRARWAGHVDQAMQAAGIDLSVPSPDFSSPGGRHGVHGEAFTDDVWPEMTGLYRAHPGAVW
jgi:ring-1,2-phenylacetyl-CoA epoxidase subunit PaaC